MTLYSPVARFYPATVTLGRVHLACRTPAHLHCNNRLFFTHSCLIQTQEPTYPWFTPISRSNDKLDIAPFEWKGTAVTPAAFHWSLPASYGLPKPFIVYVGSSYNRKRIIFVVTGISQSIRIRCLQSTRHFDVCINSMQGLAYRISADHLKQAYLLRHQPHLCFDLANLLVVIRV
jgi:hypothetical protein